MAKLNPISAAKSQHERQLQFIGEFLAGLAEVENWQVDQPIVPIRFFNLRIDLDVRRGDLGQQFVRELDRLIVRIRDMQRKFDQSRTAASFPGGFSDESADEDDDDEDD